MYVKDLIIPHWSPHKPGICTDALIRNTNTFHIGVIQCDHTRGSKVFLFPVAIDVYRAFHFTRIFSVTPCLTLTCVTVTQVNVPFFWYRDSPLLSCFTCLYFKSQISFGRSTLLDLTVPQATVFFPLAPQTNRQKCINCPWKDNTLCPRKAVLDMVVGKNGVDSTAHYSSRIKYLFVKNFNTQI